MRGRILVVLRGEPEFRSVSRSSLEDRSRGPVVVVLDESAPFSELESWQAVSGVVVLADSPSCLFGSLLGEAGVVCLAKDAIAGRVATAIRLAAREGVFEKRLDERHGVALSRREGEVFELLRLGKKPAEIALLLEISLATVRTYCAKLRMKLGVKTIRDIAGMPALRPAESESMAVPSDTVC